MTERFSDLFSNTTKGKKTVFISTLFTVVFILIKLYEGVDFKGVKLNNLIISEATLNDVYISNRVNFLFKMIGAGFLLLPLFYLFYSFVFRSIKPTSNQKHCLFLMSLIGLSISVAQIMQIQSELLLSFLFSIFLFLLFLFAISNKGKHPFLRAVASSLFWVVVVQAFILSFLFLYFLGDKFTFLPFFWLSICLLLGIYFVLRSAFGFSYRKTTFLLLPISLLPLLAFISVESVMYFSSKHLFFGYKKVLLFLTGIVFGLYFLFFLFKSKRTLYSTTSMLKYAFIPAAIVAFCLLSFYLPIVYQNTEMFELANPANAVMRVFKFNEIPFVDFMSSHMFSEQWYGIIYAFIFGFDNSLDFEIYRFFNSVLYFFVVYFFLNRLFKSPLYSLSFLLIFPFVFDLFSIHITSCLFIFFCMEKAFKTQKTIDFFYLLLLLIVLIVWKLDVGVAGVFTFILYFPLSLLFSKTAIEYRKLLKAIGLFLGVVLLVLGVALFFRNGNYIFDNFMAALHYVKANQAHGYTSIAHNYPHQFYIYHFVYPAVSIVSIVWITFLLVKNKRMDGNGGHNHLILKAALFLFILSLANGQRGLVRHGFAENNDYSIASMFFVACTLIGIYLFKVRKIQSMQNVFYGLAFSLLVLLKFFPLHQEKGHFDKAVSENTFLTLNYNIPLDSPVVRTIKNDEFNQEKINDFKAFVSKNLNNKQTFLDFSNSPMLYYYTGKKVPGYFCQNLQNSVDDYLQFHLLKYISPKSTPVVVFSNYPPTWFDATDGVPNAMRYYLVSEYIYKHYKPYGVISEKSIWVSNSFQEKNAYRNQTDSTFLLPKTFEYKHLSRIIHSFYEKNRFDGLETVQTLETRGDSLAVFKQNGVGHPHSYLSVSFEENVKDGGQTIVLCDEHGNEYDSFSFYTRENTNDYMIRISSSYHWHLGTIKTVKLKGEPIRIKRITLLKDKRCEY